MAQNNQSQMFLLREGLNGAYPHARVRISEEDDGSRPLSIALDAASGCHTTIRHAKNGGGIVANGVRNLRPDGGRQGGHSQ